jgi:antirestriction protein ArdC
MHAAPSLPSTSVPFVRKPDLRTAAGDRAPGGPSRGGRPRGRGDMDVQRVVTDRIAAVLAAGEPVLRDRWVRAAMHGMPRNGRTGVPYRGVNVLLLLEAMAAQGYACNVWLTYRQAAGLGAQVRRGARAVLCAQFARGARGVGAAAAGAAGDVEGPRAGRAQDVSRSRGVLRCEPFWLFNVAQIDGLPPEVLVRCAEGTTPPSSLSPVERVLRLLCGCDAVIRHGDECAAYLPALDEIRLPWPASFASAEAHFAAVLRALVHWSGHASRLDRDFGRRTGDGAWVFEELVAELGSIFLMGHCGLAGAGMQGHAASSCLGAWLRMLRSDPSAIFAAARHASAACAFLVAREMPRLAPLDSPRPFDPC